MELLIFASDLFAMAPQKGGEQSPMNMLVVFTGIFLIFYLLVIRPQQKKAKSHQKMIEALNKGDRVITASGIHGKIHQTFEDKDYVLLEIAEKTVVKLQKSQIADLADARPAAKDKDKDKDKSKDQKKEDKP